MILLRANGIQKYCCLKSRLAASIVADNTLSGTLPCTMAVKSAASLIDKYQGMANACRDNDCMETHRQ
jgi:hypothetical protein